MKSRYVLHKTNGVGPLFQQAMSTKTPTTRTTSSLSRRSVMRRRGFTLVELLVVIAIIGVLMALILPAVQSVRAAAARTQCANNMRQVMLGMLVYQDTFKKLPPGQDAKGFSAFAYVLPYVEQKPLFNDINFGFAWDDPVNA